MRKNTVIKDIIKTIIYIVLTVLAIWLVIGLTDYIMYKLDRPLIFVKTNIDENIITEKGLGYTRIKSDNSSSYYIFGRKIAGE